jgi:hypothetical protein
MAMSITWRVRFASSMWKQTGITQSPPPPMGCRSTINFPLSNLNCITGYPILFSH